MSKTRRDSSSTNSSSNSSRNSLWTHLPKAANEATGHPSLSQPTPPVANPPNQDQTDTASQVAEDNQQACHQHHGSQEKSSKANVLLASAYDADVRTTRQRSALNAHEEVTHRSRTRHYLQTGTENTISNDRILLTINSENTHRPRSAFGLMGEVPRGGIAFREVGNTDFDGDDAQHTTATDCFEVKSVDV